MLKYFIYCRKSSEDEERQILSIDAQKSELANIASLYGLPMMDTLEECRSAKDPGRPVFNEMLRRIERGEANAILAWKLDRLARNFDEGGGIIGLLQRGVIQEIRTFERTYLPSDNVLLMAVEFGMANQYVRDLSVNIRRGNREKIRRGVFTGKAPVGYINDPKLRTIEPHPKFFRRMKRVLELFATGEFTLVAIQQEFAKAGIVASRSKKPLSLSSIHQLLANPFYYGVFVIKGEMHPGIHVPMITKEVFEKIQKARIATSKPRHDRKRDKGLMFRNFATCGECGYSITGERHVKRTGLRFLYYRCTHKGKNARCGSRTYVRHEVFNSEVKRNAELVTLSDDWKERFLARVEVWESEVTYAKEAQLAVFREDLTAVGIQIERLNKAFVDGSLEPAEFKEMKNPLVSRRAEIT